MLGDIEEFLDRPDIGRPNRGMQLVGAPRQGQDGLGERSDGGRERRVAVSGVKVVEDRVGQVALRRGADPRRRPPHHVVQL